MFEFSKRGNELVIGDAVKENLVYMNKVWPFYGFPLGASDHDVCFSYPGESLLDLVLD